MSHKQQSVEFNSTVGQPDLTQSQGGNEMQANGRMDESANGRISESANGQMGEGGDGRRGEGRIGSRRLRRATRFWGTQVLHTGITGLVLILLFLGAARAGALDRMLTLTTAATSSSFTTINYQGRLADSGGIPIDNPNPGLGMTFALYDVATDGSALWTETHANVPVSEGLFSVRLGSVAALDTSHLTGDRWLGIQVGTDPEMLPREKLAAVPYAMVAGTVLSVSSLDASDGDPQDALVVDDEGRVGVRTTNPKMNLQVGDPLIPGSGTLQLIGSRDDMWAANILAFGDDGNNWRYWMNVRGTRSDGKSWQLYYDNREEHSGIPGGALKNVMQIIPVEDGSNEYGMYFHDNALNIGTNGDVSVAGNFSATGTKSAVVETENYGQRKLYAFEQATNRFADEGLAQLVDGAARVELDPMFLETIAEDFFIHLTPYGNASLYVAEVGADYFLVQAQPGGDDVAFVWMLTATRKGYEGVRLEPVLE